MESGTAATGNADAINGPSFRPSACQVRAKGAYAVGWAALLGTVLTGAGHGAMALGMRSPLRRAVPSGRRGQACLGGCLGRSVRIDGNVDVAICHLTLHHVGRRGDCLLRHENGEAVAAQLYAPERADGI